MNAVVTPHKNTCTKPPSLTSAKNKPGPGPVRFKPAFSFSHRHRIYARPSSHITTSTLGTHKNPFDLNRVIVLISPLPYFETECSGTSTPASYPILNNLGGVRQEFLGSIWAEKNSSIIPNWLSTSQQPLNPLSRQLKPILSGC